VTLAADRLVAFSATPPELDVIDPASWQILATHRLPVEATAYDWLLVGADPSERAVYVATESSGCLRRLQLDDGTLSAPLACGLYLEFPYTAYYRWPAFASGTAAPLLAANTAGSIPDALGGVAIALLATTFLFAAVGKLFALASVEQLLATVLPRLGRWTRATALGTIALELAVVLLVLLPGTVRGGLALAALALLAFTAFALVGQRRAPDAPCPCFGNLLASRLGFGTLVRNLILLGVLVVAWQKPAVPSPAQIALASFIVLSALVTSRLVASVVNLRRLAKGAAPHHTA